MAGEYQVKFTVTHAYYQVTGKITEVVTASFDRKSPGPLECIAKGYIPTDPVNGVERVIPVSATVDVKFEYL